MFAIRDSAEVDEADTCFHKARAYVQNGKKFLDEHVPGWLERARKSPIFDMGTFDYDILAIACKGQTLRGKQVFTAGDMLRAFSEMHLGNHQYGFYAEHAGADGGHEYDCLQLAWDEILRPGR